MAFSFLFCRWHVVLRREIQKGTTYSCRLRCGDSIHIQINIKNKKIKPDSITIKAGLKEHFTFTSDYDNIYWSTEKASVGQNIIKAIIYYDDSLTENHSVPVTLLSDIIPRSLKYRLINTYPHDEAAFTQGLIYYDGYLIESTGQKRKSSLRKVKIATGEIIQIVNLKPEYFGEGIALIKNKIYQLTWKSQTGFVYDLNTLSLLNTFNYPNYEGWGLTSVDDELIMSDGTSYIYFYEPEYFTQLRQIDVLDNKGKIAELNELEYVNGKILANILGETFIAVIDPSTGKVTGEIELKDLVPKGLEGNMNSVLNGIAYNKETNHLYVTGKYWPLLYEIEIIGNL